MIEALMTFILLAVGLAAWFFLAGQYNGIVRIRRGIVSEALQLDLAIRKELHLLKQTLGSKPENRDDVLGKISAIEILSHRGAANPLSSERGIGLLLDAKRLLEQTKDYLGSRGYCAELQDRESRCRFLIGSYQAKFESFPYSVICRLLGFALLKID